MGAYYAINIKFGIKELSLGIRVLWLKAAAEGGILIVIADVTN